MVGWAYCAAANQLQAILKADSADTWPPDFRRNASARANLLLLLISFVVCLVGAELALRLLRLGFNNTPLNQRHSAPSASNQLHLSGLLAPERMGWFEIQTDRFGNRSLKDLCDFPDAGPKRHLVMLGDSFVEGFQVSADSMAGQLQQQLCGWCGRPQPWGEQLLTGALRHRCGNTSSSIPRDRASWMAGGCPSPL